MAASNIFGKGFGSKKIKLILEANPEILKGKVMKSLNPVKGIGEKTSKPFLENLPLFYKFISNTTLSNCKERSLNVSNNVSDSEKYKTESKFKNMTIVFTGFRNKEWEKIIEEQGGKLGSSISKNTSIVVVKDPTKKSSKLDKALEIGIEIISMEDFKNKYHL
jgi:DNA ligase (NAD+)